MNRTFKRVKNSRGFKFRIVENRFGGFDVQVCFPNERSYRQMHTRATLEEAEKDMNAHAIATDKAKK